MLEIKINAKMVIAVETVAYGVCVSSRLLPMGNGWCEEARSSCRSGSLAFHNSKLVLSLHQWDLRSQLQVDQAGYATVDLKEGGGLDARQHAADDRDVLDAELRNRLVQGQ